MVTCLVNVSQIRMSKALVMVSFNMFVVRANLQGVSSVEVPFVEVRAFVMVLIEPEAVVSGRVSVESDGVSQAGVLFQAVMVAIVSPVVTNFRSSEVPVWVHNLFVNGIDPELVVS
jgi:hypothetical protein